MILYECMICDMMLIKDDFRGGMVCPYCGGTEIYQHDDDEVDTLDDETTITLKDYEGK